MPTKVVHNTRKTALKFGAVFVLSCLLAGSLVPVGLLGAAAASEATGAGEGTPITVSLSDAVAASAESEAPEDSGAPTTPSAVPDESAGVLPEATTPSAPSAPEEPAVEPSAPVEPENDHTWFIGCDEASAVTAELWVDGTFVVYGAGGTLAFEELPDPDKPDDPEARIVTTPWIAAGFAADIKRVVFAAEVQPESLAYWFVGCENLREVSAIPASVKDMTRTFFDCPTLTELPDDFAIAPKNAGCFGLSQPPVEPLATVYRGTEESVLAYQWAADGRVLVNPDAPVEPAPPVEAEDGNDVAESEVEAPADDAEVAENASAIDPNAPAEAIGMVEDTPAPADQAAANEAPEPQVNITVPSSVPLRLGDEGPNSARIPLCISNRSGNDVRIVGVRLKRADVDLPGGSWSLVDQSDGTHFVDEARFTPLGLEAVLDTPVVLKADSADRWLSWEGTFSDFGMKNLVEAVLAADGTFTYGTMIWHIEALPTA